LSFKNIFAHSSIMYKTKYAKSVGWYSDKYIYAQDYDLTVKMLSKYEFKFLKSFFVKIRIGQESMTRSSIYRVKILEEELNILKKVRNTFYLSLNNLIKNYYCSFRKKIKLYLYYLNII